MQLIKATFTPENRNKYKTAVLELSLDVERATPKIIWPLPRT